MLWTIELLFLLIIKSFSLFNNIIEKERANKCYHCIKKECSFRLHILEHVLSDQGQFNTVKVSHGQDEADLLICGNFWDVNPVDTIDEKLLEYHEKDHCEQA